MYILHIETSTRDGSVALSAGERVIQEVNIPETSSQASMLTPAIQALLSAGSIRPKDLSAICVSSGPGSYTGLRVGSSTAKAMSYSLGIPLLSVPALAGLAVSIFDHYPDADYALPMLDARRREVYAAIYDREMKEIWPVQSVILDEVFFTDHLPVRDKIVAGGDGAVKIGSEANYCPGLTIDRELRCRAGALAGLALARYQAGVVEDPIHFVPFYIKPPHITTPKKGRLDGVRTEENGL